MQINLKQNEIETALKQYIAQQGISLQGKNIYIAFTAGRKESGISAELSIEDHITLINDQIDAEDPTISLTPTIVNIPVSMDVPEEVSSLVLGTAAEVVKTTSLFG